MSSVLASKLNNLNKKSVSITIEEVTTPINSLDLLSQFQAASGGKFDLANEYIIDLMPDFIPIQCYLMLYSNRLASQCDYKTHAKASPPTICAYLTTLLFGYFLLSDLHVRPSTSVHAKIWKTDSDRHEFAEFLLSLPVPDDLEFIFSQYAPTNTDRTGNVFGIPSFAGFDHHRNFGKFIPLKSFFDLHNVVATCPGNSKPIDVYAKLGKIGSAFIIDPTGTPFSVHLLDILGFNYATDTLTAPPTKLFQIFESTFNPVLFRDFHRRSSLARIPIEVPEFDSYFYNPYDALLAFTGPNSSEMQTVFRSVIPIIAASSKSSKTLSQVLSAASGQSLFLHGYSIPSLPLSSYNSGVSFNAISTAQGKDLEQSTLSTYVKSINFLTKDTVPAESTAVPEISVSADAAPGTIVTDHSVVSTPAQYPLALLRSSAYSATTPLPQPSNLIEFNKNIHVFPKVRVLDIANTKTISAYLATLTGKVITSFELDGCVIPHPDLDLALGTENSSFADSALPLGLTVPSTAYDHTTTVTTGPNVPQRRLENRDDTSFPVGHLLFDRSQIRLPWINTRIRDPATPTLGSALAGFTYYPTNWLRAAQSFIGFKTIAPDASLSTRDSVANTPKKQIYAWSPYTVTTRTDSRSSRNSSEYSRIYYLMNLRTIFGTEYKFVEINNGMHALPSS